MACDHVLLGVEEISFMHELIIMLYVEMPCLQKIIFVNLIRIVIMLEFMFYWIGKWLCDNCMCQLSLKE
jgi:hypothetical protein